MSPHPPASPAANTPTLCPQPAGDPLGTLGLPLTPHTLPRPYPDLHWLPSGCNTNHPVPAGHEEPPNPPCSFGRGGGLTCAGYPQLPQASRLGQGQGAARGSRWQQGLGDRGAPLSAETTSPFCILVGCWQGASVPHMVPGAGGWQWGWRGFPSTAGWVGWVFFFSLYDNNYYIVCFRFFNKAFSPALLAPGWLAAGLCHHGGPTAVLSPLQKITWGCAVEVTRVMY